MAKRIVSKSAVQTAPDPDPAAEELLDPWIAERREWVDVAPWLAWREPALVAQVKRAEERLHEPTSGKATGRAYREAIATLRARLRAHVNAGEIELRIGPEEPTAAAKLVHKDALDAVISDLRLVGRGSYILRWGGQDFEVRVYRPDQASQSENGVPSAKAENDCYEWLKLERKDGAPKMSKPKYWEIAHKRFSRLSERGFVRAWARAVGDDPTWIKPGPKPKASKS